MSDQVPEDPVSMFASTRAYTGDSPDPDDAAAALPVSLGRYAIKTLLGRGGFADVFLAHDDKLDRQIALKIPRRDKFRNEIQLKAFIEEAKTAASLQHPGIVAVFDVGTEGETPFIVLEYIRGRPLSHLLTHESLTAAASARLTADIAEALAHAHERGFVHRDIKPQNILLDNEDRPHIADFGLAVRHQDSGSVRDEIAGTTQYMSPEQIRGENHRLDGRTDVWALGVIFYRMLTGRMPFTGSSPDDTFQKILYSEPEPPQRIEAGIPAELERICLRCLCPQMSGRYRTAAELAGELNDWLQFMAGESGSSGRRRGLNVEPPSAPVIPRGLRSFTKDDRDFFLKLIPGPRDRGGLPASVRFWKDCMEEREPGGTFNVGLLYGPSGCGKSSLIKAGVLPRLNSDVVSIHVDSTPQSTESEILRRARRFKSIPPELNLTESLRELRESAGLRSSHKIVLVLDQFEQWLHCWQTGSEADLVSALRQCDGGNIQCILMVRDDFWLPVSRFMRQLELGIVDGTNAMLVDSFDAEHARRVLRELGVAYKRLPENVAEQSDDQTAFISQTIEDLTEDNRLYPVRLSVFVEMVKDHPWTPETLCEMGGAKGVGVAFLENSVGSRSRPARRIHEQAARAVLSALIPESGQIKDSAKPRAELLRVSNYAARPQSFDELMHLLDVELRLLTPAGSHNDEVSSSTDHSYPSSRAAVEPVYQLTHDYLVPTIRTWLHRELRETRRGRARLLLQEQALLWNQRPARRSLPSLTEWIGLRLWTSQREWTSAERRMMRAANRRLLRQTGIVLSVILIGAIVTNFFRRQARHLRSEDEALVLVSRLKDVGIRDVPDLVKQMTEYREWVNPLVTQIVTDTSQSERNRIRAAMAALPVNDEHVDWLTQRLVSDQLPAGDFLTVRDSLIPYSDRVSKLLRESLKDRSIVPLQRFRTAAAMAAFDKSPELWNSLSEEVADSLLREPATEATVWIEALKPVAPYIETELRKKVAAVQTLESARVGALALEELTSDSTVTLVSLLPGSNSASYRAFVDVLRRDSVFAVELLHEQLEGLRTQQVSETDLENHAQQIASVVLALFQLRDTAPLLMYTRLQDDPRVRTRILHAATPERTDLSELMPLIRDSAVPDARVVAMCAAVSHLDEPASQSLREELLSVVVQAYVHDPHAAVHSIAELLLRKLDPERLQQEAQRMIGNGPNESRDWYVDRSGQTMVVMEQGAVSNVIEDASATFAIGATEVTHRQFSRLFKEHSSSTLAVSRDADIPASDVMLLEAMQYCNYLSGIEGLYETQWCYSASDIAAGNSNPLPDYRLRTGYRLPTDEEWEFACRGNTNTRCFFGTDAQFARYYGWERIHSGGLLQQISILLPNPFGLFDVYGGVAELTVTPSGSSIQLYERGAGSFTLASGLNSELKSSTTTTARGELTGFRVVRTMMGNSQ
ncbi:MAG: protein kinase [Planctomycetaceae bacterium]